MPVSGNRSNSITIITIHSHGRRSSLVVAGGMGLMSKETNMSLSINPEVQRRVIEAADALYSESDKSAFPSVDVVRRQARANMADTVAVMKAWRRSQSIAPTAINSDAPDKVQQACHVMLGTIWAEAQDAANATLRSAHAGWESERSEAEAVHQQLTSAFDELADELTTAQATNTDLQGKLDAAIAELDQVRTTATGERQKASVAHAMARARLAESEQRIHDLKAELDIVHADSARWQSRFADHEKASMDAAERQQSEFEHNISAANGRCEALAGQLGQAREEAAGLRGQLEAVQAQLVALMEKL